MNMEHSPTTIPQNANQVILDILNKNKINDLNKLLKRREMLNYCNIRMTYLFHLIQTAGIFSTTISSSYNIQSLLWAGIALNFIASIINIFEKINNSLSEQALADIVSIQKNNNYIDETKFDFA
jgi:hypothetical protein